MAPFPTLCPPPPSPPLPCGHHHTVSCVYGSCTYVLRLIPSPSFIQFPLLPPLWQLSICSMHPCLCFCFVHQFILFIRFHIQVRSYGICLSLWCKLFYRPSPSQPISYRQWFCTIICVPYKHLYVCFLSITMKLKQTARLCALCVWLPW